MSQSRAARPPPTPPPPPPPLLDQFFGNLELAKDVQDSSILSETWRYGFVCVCLLALFVLMRPWHKVHSARLHEPGILRRPAAIPTKKLQWLWAHMIPILFTPEHEVLETAGLDALIYLRVLGLGIKFFVVVTVLAYLILVPIHLTASRDIQPNPELLALIGVEGNLTTGFSISQPFTSISIVRVGIDSKKYWFHFVFIHIVIAWGCYLLYETYKLFVVLRHNYLGRVMEPERIQPSQAEFPHISKSRIGRLMKRLCCSCNESSLSDNFTDPGSRRESIPGSPTSRASSLRNASSVFRYSGRNLGIASAATAMARNVQAKTFWGTRNRSQNHRNRRLMKVITEQAVETEFDHNDEPVSIAQPGGVPPSQHSGVTEMQISGSSHLSPLAAASAASLAAAPDELANMSLGPEPGEMPKSHTFVQEPGLQPMASGLSNGATASERSTLSGMFPTVQMSAGAVVGPYSKASSGNATRASLFRNMHVKSLYLSRNFDRGGFIQNLQLGGTGSRSGSEPRTSATSSPTKLRRGSSPFNAFRSSPSPKSRSSTPSRAAVAEGSKGPTTSAAASGGKSPGSGTTAEPGLPDSASVFESEGTPTPGKTAANESEFLDEHEVDISLAPEGEWSGATDAPDMQDMNFGDSGRHQSAEDLPACFAATLTPALKHRVLTLKTVQTMLPSGRPCRVMSELYAVLVTNVPSLQKRQEIMREREDAEGTDTQQVCGSEFVPEWESSGAADSDKTEPRAAPAEEEDTGEVSSRRDLPAVDEAAQVADPTVPPRPPSPPPSEHPSIAASSQEPASPKLSGMGSGRSTMTGNTFIPQECSELGANKRRSLPKAVAKRLEGDSTFSLKNKRDVDFDTGAAGGSSVKSGTDGVDDNSASTGGDIGLEFDIVAAVFAQMFPNTFFCTIPVRKDERIQKLMFKWAAITRKLEVAETKLRLWGKRPTITIGSTLGFGGTTKDAIEHCQAELEELERQIKRARKEAWEDGTNSSTSAFVLFYDQFSATVAAQSVIHPEDGHIFNTQPAPGPDDINWKALWSTGPRRYLRRAIAAPMLLMVILFPAGMFSAAISNINLALCNTPWNGADTDNNSSSSWYCGSTGLQTDPGSVLFQLITSAALPALLLTVWQTVAMPHALYALTLFQADSFFKSKMDRRIGVYFLMWGFINVFLGGMLGGMLELANLVADPQDVMSRIGASMVSASNFFISFVQLQTLVICPLAIFQPHGGLWFYLIAILLHKRCGGCCLLEGDVKKTWEAKSYRYGREIPIHMLIFLLGTVYCTSSPGILPFCLMYFTGFWMVRRYQTLYVFERTYESGGLFWPLVFDTVIMFLLTFQIFMSAVLVTFSASTQAGLLFLTVPLPLFWFRRYCHARFNTTARYLPLEMADRAPPAILDPALYISPALRHGAAGWHPENRKAWAGYGMAASVV